MDQEAFEAFRAMYLLQHPSRVLNDADYKATRLYPAWLKWAVALMFVCAALLSGIHTVPVVREAIPDGRMFSEGVKDLVSMLSFVAVELSIFVTAYALVRKGNKWVLAIMCVSFAVAMAANLYSVSTALSGHDAGVLWVSIILGVGAPGITLLAGKLFVDIDRSELVQQSEAKKRRKEDGDRLDDDIIAAWNAYERKQIRSRTLPAPVQMDRPDTGADRPNGQPVDSLNGRTLTQFLDEWMDENPGYAATLSVRKLKEAIAATTGVSVSTGKLNPMQNAWRERNGIQGGEHEDAS